MSVFLKADFGRFGIDKLSNIKHTKLGYIEFIQTMTEGGNVLAGSCIMPLLSGAVYIIDSSQPHCTAPKDPAGYLRHCVTVDRASFDAFVESAAMKETISELYTRGVHFTVPDKDSVERVEKAFLRISELAKPETPDSDKLYAIFTLLLLLRDSARSTTDFEDDHTVVGRALGFLEGNITADIGTSEVAEALHVSKHYLCHVFKSKTGMTLTEYILDKRLSIAAGLLHDKKLSIGEIAARSGFSSESYFISKFRARYGMPPGKKRNQM